jgi:hypothetical protein
MPFKFHGTYRVTRPPTDAFAAGDVVVYLGRTDSSYDGTSDYAFVRWDAWAPIRAHFGSPPREQVLVWSLPWGQEPTDWPAYLEAVSEPT